MAFVKHHQKKEVDVDTNGLLWRFLLRWLYAHALVAIGKNTTQKKRKEKMPSKPKFFVVNLKVTNLNLNFEKCSKLS